MMIIRRADSADKSAIWDILQPVIVEGETYTFPRDMGESEAVGYWLSCNHMAFVAEDEGKIVGTYWIRENQPGGGAHVANAGFAVHPAARTRGIARQMGNHALKTARDAGFLAMQFNFVIATNAGAIKLWHDLGFETVARLPDVFRRPSGAFADAFVMFRKL